MHCWLHHIRSVWASMMQMKTLPASIDKLSTTKDRKEQTMLIDMIKESMSWLPKLAFGLCRYKGRSQGLGMGGDGGRSVCTNLTPG